MIQERIRTKIEEEYKNIRSSNQREQAVRREKTAVVSPELDQYLRQITSIGINAAKMVLEHKGNVGKNIEELRKNSKELKGRLEKGLEKLGLPVDYLDEIYECKKCRDRGFTDNGKCECYLKKYRKYAYEMSYLADISKKDNFENFKFDFYSKEKKDGRIKSDYEIMQKNYEVCKRYSDNFEKMSSNILLLGKSGVGKTFLCNCIAQRVAQRGNVVVYISSKRFFDVLIKADFERGNRESYDTCSPERELSEMIYECDLLIIDDLGTEAVTKMTDPEFFDVINARKIRGMKTIISTNLSENEISRRYSERIYSRITEYFIILRCVGDDLRRR